LNISRICHANAYLHFLHCFGVIDRRKLKRFAFSSLRESNDMKLKLQCLICIVAANFIKISKIIAEISHLTIFLNGSIHHLKFFKFDVMNHSYALDSYYVSSCKISSQLVIRLLRYRKRLNISGVWHENGYLHFFGCFWVKNRRKLLNFSIFELAAICIFGL